MRNEPTKFQTRWLTEAQSNSARTTISTSTGPLAAKTGTSRARRSTGHLVAAFNNYGKTHLIPPGYHKDLLPSLERRSAVEIFTVWVPFVLVSEFSCSPSRQTIAVGSYGLLYQVFYGCGCSLRFSTGPYSLFPVC